MRYTIENIEQTLQYTKKSFLIFGEYLTQSKKTLDSSEYDIGTELMKLLLMNINSYQEIINKSKLNGFISDSHNIFIKDSLDSLLSINKTIDEQYGDIDFK